MIVAIQFMDASVFIPNLKSWQLFWMGAGRPALIIIYVSLIGVLLRRKLQKSWRVFHALMYIALFFGIVHGNLLGSTFGNIAIILIYDLLFAGSIMAFSLKRLQQYRFRKIRQRKMVSNENLK